MKIEIRSLNFSLSLSQHRYIEERLAFALDASADRIEHAELWLSEIHLASGNVLKRCVIHVTLKGETQVVTESSDSGLRIAIDRAANQASWKVARSIEPQHRPLRAPHFGAIQPGMGAQAAHTQRSA